MCVRACMLIFVCLFVRCSVYVSALAFIYYSLLKEYKSLGNSRKTCLVLMGNPFPVDKQIVFVVPERCLFIYPGLAEWRFS